MREIERNASEISLSARPLSAKNKRLRNESGDNSNATHLLTMDDSNNQLLLYEGGRNHQLVVNDTIEDITSNNFTATFETSQLNGATTTTTMRQNHSTNAFSRVDTNESI